MLYSMLTVLQKVYKNQCILMIFQIFLHSNFEPQHKTKVYKKHQKNDPKLIKKVSQNWLQGVVSNTYDMMPNTHPKNVPKWAKRLPRELQNRSNFVPKVYRKCLSSAWPRFGPPGTVFGGLFGSFWDRFGRRLGVFCRILELFRAFLGGVWALFARVGRHLGFCLQRFDAI